MKNPLFWKIGLLAVVIPLLLYIDTITPRGTAIGLAIVSGLLVDKYIK